MRRPFQCEFCNDVRGGVAIVFGLVLPALIGFAGLAVDGAYWMMERNKLQSATDSAALSAAQTIQLNGTDQSIATEAKKLLLKTYNQNLAGVRFTVQHPPATGPMAGNAAAVAVLAERDQPVFFLGLFGMTNTFVATRSVAHVDSMSEACLLALSKTADKAIEVTGSSIINLKCGMASNSNSNLAVYLSGSSNTAVSGVSAAGDIYQSTNAQLTTSDGPPKSNASEITDPYGPEGRNLVAPKANGACTERNLKVQSDTTLSPGRYCGGIDFTGGTATFEPGVYLIDGGDFNANGNAALVGEGVTFIFTAVNNNVGVLNINGSQTVSLHAPKSGTNWDGILFFKGAGDGTLRCNGMACQSTINGGANLDLGGSVYMPSDQLSMSGGASSSISCLQIVADKITITGNSAITGTCQETDGTEKLTRSTVELVE